MHINFNKRCVLVMAAFVLTLLPDFGRSERSLVSLGDKVTNLLGFLLLGLVEEATVERFHGRQGDCVIFFAA